MAKTNLFTTGDLVNTKYGVGTIIKNCFNFMFWEVDIENIGIKKIKYTEIELV